MREEETNWFAKWEEELPPPEDLTPLSQSLITPDLALAFNIPTAGSRREAAAPHLPHSAGHSSQPTTNSSAEFDSPETGGADEPARTLKRPRLVWTPQLHKRFVDAVAHLGIKNAVPKTIMQLMSVDGLTRENVASHLQKYRLYLKRMQGMSGRGGGAAASVDAATDHLFATSPVPPHFLHPGRAGPNSDHFFAPVAVAAASAAVAHHQLQMQGHFRHFNGSPPNGQYEHPFVRTGQRIGGPVVVPVMAPVGYAEDLESGGPGNGRKVLTLFPTGDD